MGFYSYTCCKTNLPILASTSWGTNNYSSVHLLGQDGSSVQGHYDGYGRIDMNNGESLEEIDERIQSGKWKLVLSQFYSGEKFDQLGNSRHDPGQGHFHDQHKIEQWYAQRGFPSYKDYLQAFKEIQ